MKYCVYIRIWGIDSALLYTDDLDEAAREYYWLESRGGCPRLSVDGIELRIYEADELALVALRGIYPSMGGRWRKREIAKERE